MTKELVTVEFRYRKPHPENDYSTCHKSDTITIGVYDNYDDAVDAGNKALSEIYDIIGGSKFFSKTKKNRLVCILNVRIFDQFFVKISQLDYGDVAVNDK